MSDNDDRVYEVKSEDDSDEYKNAQIVYDKGEIQKTRLCAAVSYFIFFIPLLVCPDSLFARFHANQGLLLAIFAIAGNFLLAILPLSIRWIALIIFWGTILVFALLGCITAFFGKTYELPIIGRNRIIK